MRFMFLFLLCGIFFFSSELRAQTQLEMNDDAYYSLSSQEEDLRQMLGILSQRYKDVSGFQEQLKKTQVAWKHYKDAMLALKYLVDEDSDPRIFYGSVYPMCHSNYSESLIRRRSEDILPWLNGAEEGDVCSGTIKVFDKTKRIKQ